MSEACTGHTCDECMDCRRGRCCKRDMPGYVAPKLGDWDGPVFGQLGVLADDGDRAECHGCGRHFRHLGNHVARSHGLTCDEYRAIFGLKATTGLIGPALAEIRRKTTEHLAPYRDLSAKALRALTSEQRAENRRVISLEEQRSKNGYAQLKEAGVKGRAAYAANIASGKTPKPKFAGGRFTNEEINRLGVSARRALYAAHPELKTEWADRISKARRGRTYADPIEYTKTCTECGSVFSVGRRWSKRILCSRACLLKKRSRIAIEANVTHRPDVRTKISAYAKARYVEREKDAHGRFAPGVHL